MLCEVTYFSYGCQNCMAKSLATLQTQYTYIILFKKIKTHQNCRILVIFVYCNKRYNWNKINLGNSNLLALMLHSHHWSFQFKEVSSVLVQSKILDEISLCEVKQGHVVFTWRVFPRGCVSSRAMLQKNCWMKQGNWDFQNKRPYRSEPIRSLIGLGLVCPPPVCLDNLPICQLCHS